MASKNTHDSLRALNAQRGGTAVPLQIARWHLFPVCLFDKILRPRDGQEDSVHDKRSRKDDGPLSWISDPLPGTASMSRHRQSDGCSQYAPTAARSCCQPSIHETIPRRTVAAFICTVPTPRPNAALCNGPSQSSGTKFGTYGSNAETAQDQLSNTCVLP